MDTKAHAALTQYHKLQRAECGLRQCVRGDPKNTVPVPYHEPCGNATHTVLRVQEPVSTDSEPFTVNIFNGSNGVRVSVGMKSTDTIGKLQQKVLKRNPDFGANPNLLYNGKPVQLQQTLSELQVKPGATFITYQKCIGG
ncbi:hypothetical protein R3I93_005756 [Phoxinus phoxinus]|uniref:Ubiquitin-like domain-containing protein n=1 Tax=Phoxinus phoxinus TaxID=58324 RepID=A0AAN9D9K4_9TELE